MQIAVIILLSFAVLVLYFLYALKKLELKRRNIEYDEKVMDYIRIRKKLLGGSDGKILHAFTGRASAINDSDCLTVLGTDTPEFVTITGCSIPKDIDHKLFRVVLEELN